MGKKNKTSHKQLITAAKDMNKVMGLDPAIELDLDKKDLIKLIKREATGYEAKGKAAASSGVSEFDTLAEDTWDVFDSLDVIEETLNKRDDLIANSPDDNDNAENGESTMATKKKSSTKKSKQKSGKTNPAKKPAVAKKKTAAGTVKKPGVIATIIEIVKTHGPISKEGILKRLAKKFPDREEEAMAKTITVQVPTRINKERDIKVVKDDKNRWSVK